MTGCALKHFYGVERSRRQVEISRYTLRRLSRCSMPFFSLPQDREALLMLAMMERPSCVIKASGACCSLRKGSLADLSRGRTLILPAYSNGEGRYRTSRIGTLAALCSVTCASGLVGRSTMGGYRNLQNLLYRSSYNGSTLVIRCLVHGRA